MVTSTRNNILSVIDWINQFYSFLLAFFFFFLLSFAGRKHFSIPELQEKREAFSTFFRRIKLRGLWLSKELEMNSECVAAEKQLDCKTNVLNQT